MIKNHDSMFFAPLVAREQESSRADDIADWLFGYRDDFVTLTVTNGFMKCIQCEREVGTPKNGKRDWSIKNIIYEDDGDFTCDECFDTVYEDKAKLELGYE